jgi:hypothetical protein
VIDRNRFASYQAALEIIRTIRRMYGDFFMWKQPPHEYEYELLPVEVLLGVPVADFFGS